MAHLSGDSVGQYRITGNSTQFTTDPVTRLCPTPPSGYSISPIWQITVYSVGTVRHRWFGKYCRKFYLLVERQRHLCWERSNHDNLGDERKRCNQSGAG